MTALDPSPAPTRIRSVQRASRLLLWLARQPDGASATEAARVVGIALPTAHHLLSTLVAEGLLTKDSGRRYGLGLKVAVLADAHLRRDGAPELLLGALRALAQETGETAYLAGWRGDEIRALACVAGASAVRVGEVEAGPYHHAHARATGKLLLAFADAERRRRYLGGRPLERRTPHTICDAGALDAELARIREAGYAVDRQEFVAGVSCVAAPVVESGVVVATFTVSAPSERFDATRDALVAAALRCADSVRSRVDAELAAHRRSDPLSPRRPA